MPSAGIETTQRWFPTRLLTNGSLKVLNGFVRDRGLDTESTVTVLETYESAPVSSAFEAPRHLFERELEFRGMGPLQARNEAGLEGARRRWADQTRVLARRVEALLPGPWLTQASNSCELADRRARIGASWRPAVFHAFAWGMVLAAVLAVVTALMARSGVSLTPILWSVIILSVGLGLFAAFLAFRRSERDAAQMMITSAVEWRQAVMALEINAVWIALRSGPSTFDEAVTALGESPLTDDSMRLAAVDLDQAITGLYWAYRDLVEQVFEDAVAFDDADLSSAAERHLDELVHRQGEFSPRITPVTSESILDAPDRSDAITEQDGIISVVLALLFSMVVGFAQLGIPVVVLEGSACSFANADVKIETCDDLTDLNAVGAELSKVKLDRKDLSEGNFDNANLAEASLFKANLTNSSMIDVNLTKASGQESDLSGADMVGANLSGADFSSAIFAGADLSNANLSKVDLSGASFVGANLSGANLSGVNLQGADLTDANLQGTNLTDAKYADAIFAGVDFSGNNLSRFDLSGLSFELANFSQANLQNVSFENSNLLGVDITGANITGLKLAGATIAGVSVVDLLDGGAKLEGVDLVNADFAGISGTGITLTDTDLNGVNLSQLDLSKATFDGSSFRGANLSGADLTGASLKDSDLANADLTLVDISTSNMDGASLTGADLTDARALNASFLEARFSDANLIGADFSGSNLTGASGLGATALRAQWRGALCPNGSEQEICR